MKTYYLSSRALLLAIILFLSLLALPYGTVLATEIQNINAATATQLTAVKGIGTKTASLIIEYRDAHKSIKNIDELLTIRGIGEKTLEKIKASFAVTGNANKPNPCTATPEAIDKSK